ncbi:MAG: endonuclease domain-containing protein [Chloroflexi bacterium]|nr:endonuclease domain-containing protein [Chloroflexota bacterium]
MGDKPNTHTDPVIYDDIKQLARHMRRNPTPAEDLIWQRIRKKQVHGFRFRRQHAIERFIVDFYCFEARLVLEIDGGIHNEPGHAANDEERQRYLESLGLHVLRFTNAQVMHKTDAVVHVIGEWLTKYGASIASQPGRK